MKAILRSAIVAAGMATALATSMTPASADTGAVAFTGTASITCFGCGDSNGTAALTGVGATVEGGVVNGSATATYTVHEDNAVGIECVVSGTANGSTTGAVAVNFNWTRVGAVAVITTSGQINGAGVAGFAVTSPVGPPCGGPVQALVVGAIAGT